MREYAKNRGHGENMPPLLEHVKIYFQQKGLTPMAAENFYKYHKGRRWKTDKGVPIRNWKVVATNWIWTYRPGKPLTLDQKLRQRSLVSMDSRMISLPKTCSSSSNKGSA